MDKPVKIPGPDHPITITPSPSRVVVTVAGKVVANSSHALSLKEASYPAVLYIPRGDVDMSLLARTDHTSYCPYKGDASYYSITASDGVQTDVVWSYREPYNAVAEIAGYVAFYTDKVDVVVGAEG